MLSSVCQLHSVKSTCVASQVFIVPIQPYLTQVVLVLSSARSMLSSDTCTSQSSITLKFVSSTVTVVAACVPVWLALASKIASVLFAVAPSSIQESLVFSASV